MIESIWRTWLNIGKKSSFVCYKVERALKIAPTTGKDDDSMKRLACSRGESLLDDCDTIRETLESTVKMFNSWRQLPSSSPLDSTQWQQLLSVLDERNPSFNALVE